MHNVAKRLSKMETGNWPLTLARAKLFDKSYSSAVMGIKAQQEWGEGRLGGQEEEETVFC